VKRVGQQERVYTPLLCCGYCGLAFLHVFTKMFSRSTFKGARVLPMSGWQMPYAVPVVGLGALFGTATLFGTVHASEDSLHPPQYPWSHRQPWQSFDTASIRRGHQVYSEVCKACHSVSLLAFRNLVDVAYTEEEAKAIAASVEIEDGPNDEGEMFTRPGKLSDYMPKSYKNDEAARAANGGALPPDLSLMIKARPHGADYVFQLITGYRKKPAGVKVREGLHYNPYFPGGAIGMPPPLMPNMLEYEDGTEATVSQMAKDVVTFLSWAAEPEHDTRKKLGFKILFLIALMAVPTYYYKRQVWSVIKTRVIQYHKPLY